jgi:mannose-6-phosphate isomerase-like protein (cupin superfamily)
MKIFRLSALTIILLSGSIVTESQYLKRSLSDCAEKKMDLCTSSAHYFPVFGAGDDSSGIIKGIIRYGNLNLDPDGKSKTVSYPDQEQIMYISEGTGTLICDKEEVPVSRNDFIYIPAGSRFSLSNPRERKLSVLIMGFRIMPGKVKPSSKMMLANADDVQFQILGSHGPSTTFQLLMGTTESTRDKLAAACQVTSLFVMDFAAGGTNIPHRHDEEEEIYYILRGKGDIVAGQTGDGKELRHTSKQGDAYFFPPETLIGFYSGNTECEEHARILAVRFKYPVK